MSAMALTEGRKIFVEVLKKGGKNALEAVGILVEHGPQSRLQPWEELDPIYLQGRDPPTLAARSSEAEPRSEIPLHGQASETLHGRLLLRILPKNT